MKYFVTLQNEEFEIDLARAPEGGLVARVGDREYRVDLREIEARCRYSILLDHRSFDVMVDVSSGRLHLQVKGHRLDARVEDQRQRSARQIAAHLPQGPTVVHSVMPGILRAVQVKVGDHVREGQPLMILEAMKMENEILAEQPGVVSRILVQAGTAVEGNAPLLVLDPPPESS